MTATLFGPDEDPSPSAMDGWADISDDGVYRYRLGRRWQPERGTVLWVMLNPSTADGLVDDQTITKCCGFSSRWGYGAIDVVNHYAYRATQPDDLIAAHRAGVNVRGPRNAMVVVEAIQNADLIVAAWGATIRKVERAGARPMALLTVARDMGKTVHRLGALVGKGDPRHPSRPGYATPLVECR